MKKLLGFVVLGLLWCNFGFAYTAKGKVSCGTIISSHEDDPDLTSMMVLHINGYITGRNYETNGSVGKGYDHDSLYQALLKYCRENPLKDNVDAEEYIYQKLK